MTNKEPIRLSDVDTEFVSLMFIYDENKSVFFQHNLAINYEFPNKVDKTNKIFDYSNLMHTNQ